MAEKRPSRVGNELPAAESPRSGESRSDAARAENARSSSDSHLRLVTPDAIFPEEPEEPNDDSPTIISKMQVRSDSNSGRDKSDLRGRKIAHFELIEAIGVGGMAAVLRARDTQLDRFVALKILPPEMAKDPENIRRFHQEARAAARLDHENIARVFFCGEDQGLHFIAFEYVEGDNLRTVLERRKRIPVAEAVRYVLQVATGLEHAASRGVVHRDIKPSNIIVSPNGRAKVVDMGLARSLEPHADNGLTQSGVTLGTFDYISPEQALEPREADSRSDIYSLGCTFYHMLTGQAPVPEGTAAKKLHHHQHVAPVDPRQLNPEIPDEVALILSKMMAKNPRDRYARPIQLVHHLMRIAKIDGEGQSPETLFVDVQMPVEPHRRPMLFVSLAVFALAGLLFVLSLAPQPTKKNVDPPKKANSPDVAVTPVEPKPAQAPVVVASSIRTEEDLQKALDRATDNERITLDADIALTGKLKLVGSARSRPVIDIVGVGGPVRLTLSLDKAPTAAVSGMRIDNASATFKNVRFEIVAGDTVKKLDVPVSSVSVTGASVVDFDQCSFSQTGLPLDQPFILRRPLGLIPAASVSVDAASKPDANVPKVMFRDCVFATGQTGIVVAGSGKVIARDCAFHTLGGLVQLKGGGEPVVAFEHCSAYLRNGPAFRIDDDTAPRLKVDYSIFSVPDNSARTGDSPDLVRQTDSLDTSKITYQGQSNAYHNLNTLWIAGSQIVSVDDLKRFRAEAALGGGYDKESQIAPKEPRPFVNESARSEDQALAFELNPAVKELQTPPARHNDHPMLGTRKYLHLAMRSLPPLVPETPAVVEYKLAANEKVVDPDHVGNAPGYFESIAEALAVARPGDVITLKPGAASPDFAIKPSDLEADLTLRGFPGTHPTLTLADTRISEPSLFRLLDGKLTIENLHLTLEPTREHTSQSLVAFVGGGSCLIKGCTVTLKPRDRMNPRGVPLSVAVMASPDDAKIMMNEPRPSAPPPSLTLQDTFVRGEGDVLTLRGSRPATLTVAKSLVLLGGSLLNQHQGAPKELANPDLAISVRLNDSAFFFVEPLFSLRLGRGLGRSQQTLRVEQADHCLFVAMGKGPLVQMETPEASEKALPQLFDWKGRSNAFAQFEKTPVYQHAPADDPLRVFQLDEAGWRDAFEGDVENLFVPAAFKSLPLRTLPAATLDDIVLRPEAQTELLPYLTQLPKFR